MFLIFPFFAFAFFPLVISINFDFHALFIKTRRRRQGIQVNSGRPIHTHTDTHTVVPTHCLLTAFNAAFVPCRILATWLHVVQRLCHLRRARLLVEHSSHVLHQPGTLHGHTESARFASSFYQTSGRHQDSHCLGHGHAGVQFNHGAG